LRHAAAIATFLLSTSTGCTGGEDAPPDPSSYTFPLQDPDGGTAAGTLTTDLASTAGGTLLIAAFDRDAGVLVAGKALGEVSFPVDYELDGVPGGHQIIRALLDFPPYTLSPFVESPGTEDATGVFLNASNIVPVTIRPGVVSTRVNFFLTRVR
jgi:hypothetical protein